MDNKGEFNNYNEWLKNAFNYELNVKEYNMFANYYKKNYLRHIGKNKTISILEIACGLGHFGYFLMKEGYNKYIGIDLDELNIQQCKKIGLHTIEADMYSYIPTLKDGSIDLIVMNDIIEHIEKEKIIDFMKLLKTKLSANGKVLIKTCNCNNIYGLSGYFSDFTHVVGYTGGKLKHLGILSGYSKVKSFNIYLYPNKGLLDLIFNIPFFIYYKIKKILFYLNGKTDNEAFSKNVLSIFYK